MVEGQSYRVRIYNMNRLARPLNVKNPKKTSTSKAGFVTSVLCAQPSSTHLLNESQRCLLSRSLEGTTSMVTGVKEILVHDVNSGRCSLILLHEKAISHNS